MAAPPTKPAFPDDFRRFRTVTATLANATLLLLTHRAPEPVRLVSLDTSPIDSSSAQHLAEAQSVIKGHF